MPAQCPDLGGEEDGVAQIGQSADDPVVAPGALLPRHAHHQGLDLLVDRGAAGGLVLLGSVKLLGHELVVPAENRGGLDNLSDFLQSLFTELLADVRQGLALAVTQSDASLDLVA